MTRDQCLHLACKVAMSLKPGDALTLLPLMRALMEAVGEEREACAKIADGQREQTGNTPDWYCACGCIADEIRERGK